LDFGTGYKTTLFGSEIDVGIDGTYIFTFDSQFSSAFPSTSFRNTTYNPIDLRLRGHALAALGHLSAGLYLNFTNSYTDTNFVPYGHVASWTTADAVLGYEFASARSANRGMSLALSVTNLTDRDPPHISGRGYGINYDGVNANALGRFFSLRLQKLW
jgi:outer membrane receptor protein involved in Fe transport